MASPSRQDDETARRGWIAEENVCVPPFASSLTSVKVWWTAVEMSGSLESGRRREGWEREIADEISQRKIGYARQGFPTRGFTSLVSRKDLDKKKFRSTTNDWAQENNLLLFHSSDDLMAFSDILHEVSASVNWPQKEKIRHEISHKEEIFCPFFTHLLIKLTC